MHPNTLDPVRSPETAGPWVGNMLNDQGEVYDAGSDAVRRADEDYSDFANTIEEEDVSELLRPGDLVSFYS